MFCLQGYQRLLSVLGSNLPEFLNNLNALHMHLLATFPKMQAPSFRCEKVCRVGCRDVRTCVCACASPIFSFHVEAGGIV